MLLEHFQLFEEAMAVREAVDRALEKGIVTPDLNAKSNYGTSHVGDFIADNIVDSSDDDLNMNDENIGLGKSTII
jgi:3-isopropylmalate dehydrogenase